MPARMSEQRAGDRRHQFDRRSPLPRRTGLNRRREERRSQRVDTTRDRRQDRDRRGPDRRAVADRRNPLGRRRGPRRRATPTPYTAEELAAVRTIFSTRGAVVRCPSCDGSYTLGNPRKRGDDVLRQVRCLSCGRSAVVTNSWIARVLVIERTDVIRDTMRTILTGAGHEVIDAADAAVGLEAFRALPADVVFISLMSSGRLDAGEFIRQLRKEFPDVAVVAVSGRGSHGVANPLAMAMQLGAARTIRLPFTRDDVLQALEEARP